MRRWFVLWVGVLFSGACLAVEEESLAVGEQALTSAEQVEYELQQTFDDAACYCEASLLIPLRSSALVPPDLKPQLAWPPAGSSDAAYDARLRAYATRFSSGGARNTCTSLSTASPRGVLPNRVLTAQTLQTELETNGCMSNKAGWSASRSAESTSAGFCRADLNYCIAQELQVKAESLARAPTTRAARDAILAEARTRYAVAGNQYGTAFSEVNLDHCGPSVPPPQYGGVCKSYHTCTDISFGYDVGSYSETKTFDHEICNEICDYTRRPPCRTICNSECATYTTQQRNALRAAIPESAKATDGKPLRDLVAITGKPSGNQCKISGSRPIIRAKAEPPCTCAQTVYPDMARCEQLKTGFGDRVLTRAADCAAQVGELATLEATSRMAASDAVPVPPATDPVSYGSRVWGPGSGREGAARALVGNPASGGVAPQPFAHNLQIDGSGARALALLERFEVALPYEICSSGSSGWVALSQSEMVAFRLQMLSDLGDHAIEMLGLPLLQDPLQIARDDLYVDEHAIDAAISLLKDELATLDVDHVFVPVEPSPQHAGCDLAAFRLGVDGIQPRTSLPYVASLAQTGGALAAAFVEGWYTAPVSAIGALGAAQQLHLMRRNLTTLSTSRAFTGARASRVQDAVQVVDGYAGPAWTDWQMTCFYGCGGSWRATGELLSPSAEVGLATEANAACLLHGRAPGTEAPCASDAFKPVTLSPSPAYFRWSSRPSVQFSMSDVIPGQRWFVMERTCGGAEGTCRHRVVDVIDTAVDDAVHTYGGKLGRLLDHVLAKNPDNPAEARHNALGIESTAVPSMSVGLSGTVLGNWYDHYVFAANGEVQDVTKRLDAATQREIEILQQGQKASFEADSIALSQQAVLTKACGNAQGAGCTSARIPEVKLGELGLVPAPGPDPGGAETGESCLHFLATFAFALPPSGIKSYVSKNLKASLRCTRWASLVLASEATLRDVPESVRTQLLQGSQDGLFSEVGGEVAAQYLALFQRLRDFRVALREFDTASQVAGLRLDNALSKVSEEEKSWWDKFYCYSSGILRSTAVLATAAGAIAAGAPTGGTATVALLAAVSHYAGNGADGLGAVNNLVSLSDCSDNTSANVAARDAFAQVLTAMEDLRHLADHAENLISDARRADIALDAIESEVAIAAARNRIELDMISLKVQLDPTTRFAQALNVRDAYVYLLEAQRSLFRARRAFEFRTGEDLRWMSGDTAFSFGSPSAWANDAFGADFPGITGGARGPAIASALVLHAKRISALLVEDDYQNFRPFSLGESTRVLRLSEMLAATDQGSLDQPLWKRLSFACKLGGPAFLPAGHTAEDDPESLPCASRGGVSQARVEFEIPTPYYGYFRSAFELGSEANYRIVSMAVNLIGAPLHRCFGGPTPELCEENKDVPYSLRQHEGLWLESLDGHLRNYTMRPGVIQADALANDQTITATSLAIIKPYEQTQLRDRPLAGTMMLTLHSPVGREVVYENLDDIQFVVRYEYWISQE